MENKSIKDGKKISNIRLFFTLYIFILNLSFILNILSENALSVSPIELSNSILKSKVNYLSYHYYSII